MFRVRDAAEMFAKTQGFHGFKAVLNSGRNTGITAMNTKRKKNCVCHCVKRIRSHGAISGDGERLRKRRCADFILD